MALSRDDVRTFCGRLPAVTSDYPFGPEAHIFRAGGKIFALLSEVDERLSLKCDPALAESLRASFPEVTPGYHLNKRHWNTIRLDGSLSDGHVLDMIEHSYDLVFASLPKGMRDSRA